MSNGVHIGFAERRCTLKFCNCLNWRLSLCYTPPYYDLDTAFIAELSLSLPSFELKPSFERCDNVIEAIERGLPPRAVSPSVS